MLSSDGVGSAAILWLPDDCRFVTCAYTTEICSICHAASDIECEFIVRVYNVSADGGCHSVVRSGLRWNLLRRNRKVSVN